METNYALMVALCGLVGVCMGISWALYSRLRFLERVVEKVAKRVNGQGEALDDMHRRQETLSHSLADTNRRLAALSYAVNPLRFKGDDL